MKGGGAGGGALGGCFGGVEGSTPLSCDEKWGWGFCSGFLGWLGGLASLSFADVACRPLEPVAERN